MYVVYGLSVVKTAELQDFPAELKTAASLYSGRKRVQMGNSEVTAVERDGDTDIVTSLFNTYRQTDYRQSLTSPDAPSANAR